MPMASQIRGTHPGLFRMFFPPPPDTLHSDQFYNYEIFRDRFVILWDQRGSLVSSSPPALLSSIRSSTAKGKKPGSPRNFADRTRFCSAIQSATTRTLVFVFSSQVIRCLLFLSVFLGSVLASILVH